MSFELIDEEKFEIENQDIWKLDDTLYEMSRPSVISLDICPDQVSYNVFYVDGIVDIWINFTSSPLTNSFDNRSEKREEIIKLTLEKADEILYENRHIVKVTVFEDRNRSFIRTFKRKESRKGKSHE